MKLTISGREPAFWIGLVGSCIVAVLGVLTGQGVLTDAAAGKVTDVTLAIVQVLTIFAPLIAGLFIRQQVTPTSQPSLPMGTPVTTPAGSGTVTPTA